MRVALVLGGGEVGVTRSFLGVHGEFGGGKGTIVEGGVDGRIGGSKSDCTSSALPFESAGEGGHGIVIGGCAAGLGAATGTDGGGCDGCVSAPCWAGKLLSSKVTSLDCLRERVCLSQTL